MVQIINSSELSKSSTKAPNFLLRGLIQSHIGILYAAPDMGKSHLVMSLAIECATGQNLLGLTKKKDGFPVLLISAEDEQPIVAERYQKKIGDIRKGKTKLSNLDFLFELPPISIPKRSSAAERAEHKSYLEWLAAVFSKYNLVIIDTVTESIGEASEVEDERSIKNDFQFLAQKSGASMLLVHHVNKDVIRGDSKMSMASGAGLTSLMRLSKFQLGLTVHPKEKEKRELVFLKANYLSAIDKRPIKLAWTQNGTLISEEESIERRNKGERGDFTEPDRDETELEGTKMVDAPERDFRDIL